MGVMTIKHIAGPPWHRVQKSIHLGDRLLIIFPLFSDNFPQVVEGVVGLVNVKGGFVKKRLVTWEAFQIKPAF